jgi:hypothetical protein
MSLPPICEWFARFAFLAIFPGTFTREEIAVIKSFRIDFSLGPIKPASHVGNTGSDPVGHYLIHGILPCFENPQKVKMTPFAIPKIRNYSAWTDFCAWRIRYVRCILNEPGERRLLDALLVVVPR